MQEALLEQEQALALAEAAAEFRNDALESKSSSWPSALPVQPLVLGAFSSSPLDRLCEPLFGKVDRWCHKVIGRRIRDLNAGLARYEDRCAVPKVRSADGRATRTSSLRCRRPERVQIKFHGEVQWNLRSESP